MDSINKNQPEDNHQDLSGQTAIKKLKQLIDKASSCFFCTSVSRLNQFNTRPMSVLKTDDEGNLWFMSAKDSRKNREIGSVANVRLLFQGDPHSDFLSLEGVASITTDKERIRELWNPMLKTWFTEGEDDPRISVIKVAITDGYYWDTKHPTPVSFIKRIIGAVVGKTLDDSVEGNLSV